MRWGEEVFWDRVERKGVCDEGRGLGVLTVRRGYWMLSEWVIEVCLSAESESNMDMGMVLEHDVASIPVM